MKLRVALCILACALLAALVPGAASAGSAPHAARAVARCTVKVVVRRQARVRVRRCDGAAARARKRAAARAPRKPVRKPVTAPRQPQTPVVDPAPVQPGPAPEQPAPAPTQPAPAPTQPAPTPTVPAQPAPDADPLAAAPLYVDPNSLAAQAATQLDDAGRHDDAAALRGMAAVPQAVWFGDFSGPDIAGAVDRVVGAATAQHRLPVLVAYEIPGRDCGLYSAGGSADATAYRSWIDGFARGIAGRPAAVVVEPDALAGLDCLDAAGQTQREQLIAYAAQTIAATGATVYLDAGHDGWQPVSVMATRLRAAGIQYARGFSLNVSNFDATAPEAAYGQQLGAALGGKHFVIDTSRNGNGAAPDAAWCNPPGRAIGTASTAATGIPGADGLLWVKRPGESDGTCNGGPAAGVFWTDYALALLGR